MTNKPSNKNKRSKLISISILAIGLIIFAVSQFFMGNVVYLYKRYVNGSEFSMGEYQYEVSEEFVIFDKSDNFIFLIFLHKKEVSSVTISKFSSNYVDMLLVKNDTQLMVFEDHCKVYKVITPDDSQLTFFWLDDKTNILLEASIDNYWPKDLSFCDVVKPIAV